VDLARDVFVAVAQATEYVNVSACTRDGGLGQDGLQDSINGFRRRGKWPITRELECRDPARDLDQR
jgi:hypothetical protein